MDNETKHPEIKVRLTGTNGNTFALVAKVGHALKRAKVERHEVEAFITDALSGDRDHAIQTCMRWVTVS